MSACLPDPLPTVWDPACRVSETLQGRRGLVVGIANEHSIPYGCAAKLRAFGADLAVTWLNEKAARFVRPLAEGLGASIAMPLDVEQPGQLETVFERIAVEWGRRDVVIHAYAVSPRPRRTRAASGIAQFDEPIDMAVSRAPAGRLVDIAEVGRVVAFLLSSAASGMTGDTIDVDGGLHDMA